MKRCSIIKSARFYKGNAPFEGCVGVVFSKKVKLTRLFGKIGKERSAFSMIGEGLGKVSMLREAR